jgi:hypothetical protein
VPPENFHSAVSQQLAQNRNIFFILDRHTFRGKLFDLHGQPLQIPPRNHPLDLEAVGKLTHEIQGIHPYGTGRAEQRNGSHE